MVRKFLIAAMLIAATPGGAQDLGAPQPQERPAPDLRMLEDLARTMRDAMEAYGEKLAPWIDQLGRLLDDPDAYDPPELLPNGDILIRRKPGTPPVERPDAENDRPGLDL